MQVINFVKKVPIFTSDKSEAGYIELTEDGMPLKARILGTVAWLVTSINEDGSSGIIMPTRGWLVYYSDFVSIIEVVEDTNTLISFIPFQPIQCFKGLRINKKVCLELKTECRTVLEDLLIKDIENHN